MGNSEFYEIARETARIISEKSWEKNGVLQVMLYGSALHSSQPRDIDLLVIHSGEKLAPYFFYRKIVPDAPVGEQNSRMPACDFLRQLGYKEGAPFGDNVLANVEALVSPRKVNDLYDLNALSESLLIDEDKRIRDPHIIAQGFAHDFEQLRRSTKKVRERAIQACKETSFWHTILSEGRIYNQSSGDFSNTVSEIYPNALRLFPST